MNISDEMIEAGGAALDRLQGGNRGAGFDRGAVRAIAQAVAPFIAAQALREAGLVGRCGNQAPTVLPIGQSLPLIICALPSGHAGWHRSESGTQWNEGER